MAGGLAGVGAGMFAGTVTRQSAREMLVEALVNRIRLSGGMVWTGRGVSPPARRRTSPRRVRRVQGVPGWSPGRSARGIAVRPGEVVAASE